jgi:hypothetical protein
MECFPVSLSLSLSLSLWQLCERNLEVELLYWELRKLHITSQGRLWKWSISFIGLHKGNLRYLAREGLANMFIGPETILDIFSCHA